LHFHFGQLVEPSQETQQVSCFKRSNKKAALHAAFFVSDWQGWMATGRAQPVAFKV
jgi:hypothetical protein